MITQEQRDNAKAKFARSGAAELEAAIADCHATLAAGEYRYPEDPYACKLWAEIDAARDAMPRVKRVVRETCPKLTHGECVLLAFFLEQSVAVRADILARAMVGSSGVSGPLVEAYRWAYTA